MPPPDVLLRTDEVAKVLRVHPKHVYRLLKKGLPARRVGSEWRFDRSEVMAWSRRGMSLAPTLPEKPQPTTGAALVASAPALIAANGDRVIVTLLRLLQESGTVVGLVQADTGVALDLLAARRVLGAGSHAGGFPTHVAGERVARIHLVTREVGLVARGRMPRLSELSGAQLASRPVSAGVRKYLDDALAKEGMDPCKIHERARIGQSHLDVCCLVARGDAEVGVASRAWSDRVGLAFRLLAREAYGLLVRAGDLGDPTVVRVCEVAQTARFGKEIGSTPGYDSTNAGEIKYDGT
ncbi:MAG TPA: helix-turn-helix transcriptional regulator [Anaeromyxobacteraceae bacterium]|nr:helix-turn-helix transcriptional regulator [Anaeromyxobacteraceae bacterium]